MRSLEHSTKGRHDRHVEEGAISTKLEGAMGQDTAGATHEHTEAGSTTLCGRCNRSKWKVRLLSEEGAITGRGRRPTVRENEAMVRCRKSDRVDQR